jgi:DNA-binding LacI/PurR family transcriptional regulator
MHTLLMCCIVLGMAPTRTDLEQFLSGVAQDAKPGERLPPIRELMRRFGVSQMVVQRAFDGLKAQGLIASEVGRGTYFRGGNRGDYTTHAAAMPSRAASSRSVLLLRRSVSIARGRVLVEALQRRFAADGQRVLEVSYTDPDHARTLLKGLPRFDACVIQSTFRTIPIDLLALLREKSEVLAIDGAALVGTEVEAVGMEWGEPLSRAIALLRQQGHTSIAYATTAQPLFAVQMGRRRFESLQAALPDCQLQEIVLPQLPDEDYAAALVAAVQERAGGAGRPPFTALVAWGIENGAGFRESLAQIGLAVPQALSVVLLGRTDLPNEHGDFFDVVGCSVADQADCLYQAVRNRWAQPASAHGLRFIPVTAREGKSVKRLRR